MAVVVNILVGRVIIFTFATNSHIHDIIESGGGIGRRYPLVWVIGSVRLGHWKWCSINAGSNPVPDYKFLRFYGL